MALYKVEICGVNTSKLPLLKNEEKDELFSLFEQTPEEWKWMETYKEWLDGKYRTQLFSYNSS